MSNFVGLEPQDKTNSCWLACASMMRNWINTASYPMENTLLLLDNGGDKFTKAYDQDQGLAFSDTQQIAAVLGLTALPPASYTIDYYFDLLSRGPLMAMIMYSETSKIAHMVIICNITGDGTSDGSFLEINDPLPIGQGNTYSISMTDFLKRFEAVVAYENGLGVKDLYSQLYYY